jgi:hypothetical protein
MAGRTPRAVVACGLLVASCYFLYVGLMKEMLHFSFAVSFSLPMLGEQHAALEGDRALVGPAGPAKGVVPQLWIDGERKTAAVVGLAGIALPAAKILCGLAAVFSPAAAERLLPTWRVLGKWSLVDAFAEMVVVALLMASGVTALHKAGFVCFILYFFCSHMAIVLLSECDEDKDKEAQEPLVAPAIRSSLARRSIMSGLAFGFFGLFVVGASLPLVELSISESAVERVVQEKVDAYGATAKMFAESMLHTTVPKLVHQISEEIQPPHGKTSLRGAVGILLTSEATATVAGSVLLLVPLLLAPIADVMLALFQEKVLVLNVDSTFDYGKLRSHLRDFAFLDVFVIGLLIACKLTSNVHDLRADPCLGLGVLVGAAACEWGVHLLAQSPRKETAKDLV